MTASASRFFILSLFLFIYYHFCYSLVDLIFNSRKIMISKLYAFLFFIYISRCFPCKSSTFASSLFLDLTVPPAQVSQVPHYLYISIFPISLWEKRLFPFHASISHASWRMWYCKVLDKCQWSECMNVLKAPNFFLPICFVHP